MNPYKLTKEQDGTFDRKEATPGQVLQLKEIEEKYAESNEDYVPSIDVFYDVEELLTTLTTDSEENKEQVGSYHVLRVGILCAYK